MPHKPDPLREQIKRLDALLKADRSERRAAEKPLRAKHRQLTEAVRSATRSLARATVRRESMLQSTLGTYTERDAAWIHGQRWRDTVAAIEKFTTGLRAAEAGLALFHSTHPEITP